MLFSITSVSPALTSDPKILEKRLASADNGDPAIKDMSAKVKQDLVI